MTKPVDIVILSNGPGEVTTWVRPVVKALRQELGDDPAVVRISVVLSPCPNASGKEAAIALSYPEVDRVQSAEHFWQFLLWGKTFENWEWRDRGVVVFLGGDQIFPVFIGKKLGYRTVVYAEWDARWHNWIDRFGVMQSKVAEKVSPKYAHKFTVVGDLMLEAQKLEQVITPHSSHSTEIIGLLPGSKAAKLSQGVPLSLAIAEYIHAKRPQTRFVIPVAPTLDLQTLASFADTQKNPFVKVFGDVSATLVESEHPVLKTETGLCLELCREHPAHELLSQCTICLTTVGANTAELGALAVPMIVMIPTQQLDAMRSWDGLPGLLANLPGVGSTFAKVINSLVLSRKGLLAWPNIWAKEEIVPELVGKLQPQEVAEIVLDFLDHPEKLAAIRAKLRSVRGESGAAQKLAGLVRDIL
ncbi:MULTISPECIES: lipid-A-disaccharide synthase [unclassified Nodularia (in: cyanobacteria)]|uniref:lipid-A-disaccharide synthase n=1 Tax=unclassified Nodularia (in: cyanobacteria) TaxID=2656917 RepID=UPI0018807082|nr:MULTISPECIES: lipid-A-disaccharide synthase [unclassified Nodularia (in: cyanobacteria)]MBE9201802.1 lipid-A-disaccharide synthase [Nodularia sp. LEGE 06071]MCC2694426.1 lipid-A-disaccharide synthase [Nodularia sp. LEGE 04288]